MTRHQQIANARRLARDAEQRGDMTATAWFNAVAREAGGKTAPTALPPATDPALPGVGAAVAKTGKPVPALDAITRELTAYKTFGAMVTEASSYRPTIRPDLGAGFAILADAYDAAREAQGDERRAYRG